ncbi:ATP-binding protein [Sphingomonas sp. URHD0057]|uniref:ATP-binding protein n=1 Tax=Sphingomonas sp. URHD0057 TaxID=1380389 RepID=UPI000684EF61|nr:ATP-binding protein [Sphingomonas sp. URHD0057]
MDTPLDDLQLAGLGARRVKTDTTPEELVLPHDAEQRLGWIAAWLTQPSHALNEWGVHHLIDGGFRALFSGPSGTGKTMAAIALAQGTERPLLSVDPRAVVSKHIGETETDLSELFARAERDRAILLFDEADALLAKRSEVKDAHDRYANLEIAYLLRRIEAFQGLAILATNSRDHLDEAAIRRLDVIVDFPLPDEAARRQLWERLLGSVKMAKSGDIDVAKLASEYELCGGEILRAVRMAALQASNAAVPLDMAGLKSAAAERVAMHEG